MGDIAVKQKRLPQIMRGGKEKKIVCDLIHKLKLNA
jgi:hypothetical protein